MMLIALFFLLLDGQRLVTWLESVSPLKRGQTTELLTEFRRVTRSVPLRARLRPALQPPWRPSHAAPAPAPVARGGEEGAEAVARHRSFSAAARELGVSASAVSQSVRQLEAQLRVTLLSRTTRSVAPTEAGLRLVEAAGPAMGQALAALTAVSARPGEVVGRLKLSVPHAAVPFVITPVLPTFRGGDVSPAEGGAGAQPGA